jgi:hypothetical protein
VALLRYGEAPILREESVSGSLSRTIGVYIQSDGNGSQPPVQVGSFRIPIDEEVLSLRKTRELLGGWGEPPRETDFTVYVGRNGQSRRTRTIEIKESGVQIWGGAPTAP